MFLGAEAIYHRAKLRVSVPETSGIGNCIPGKTEALLFRGVIGWRRSLGCSRGHIDVLARFGVTQLLARFFFDGSLIGLEALDLLGIAIIVALYFDDLFSQSFVFGALLLVDDHSIDPE